MTFGLNIQLGTQRGVLGSRQQKNGWNENCRWVLCARTLLSRRPSLIPLSQEVLYISVELVVSVYVNVLLYFLEERYDVGS